VVQLIPLNGVGACMRRSTRYPKTGAAVEGPRRDARPGCMRSLMTVGPRGHVHVRRARTPRLRVLLDLPDHLLPHEAACPGRP